jgi:RimJ/RimL family protein N-acetyltransferase
MEVTMLRPVEPEDIAVFFAQQCDPEACALAAFPARDRAAHEAHWAKVLREPTNITRTIVIDGQTVGNIGSWLAEGHREVGYWLGREYWGQGYATAALAAFLAEIRERPLYAHVAAHNRGSRRVLEKCGFVLVDEAAMDSLAGEYLLVLPFIEAG